MSSNNENKGRRLSKEEFREMLQKTEEHNNRIRSEELTEYKARAAAEGKEPFDLDKLAEYIDLTWRVEYSPVAPQEVTREEKFVHYEYKYYVMNPDLKNLKEFAAHVEMLRLWDLE